MLFKDLPREIIEEVLILCDPFDIAQVAQTCSEFYAIICHAEDTTLWRKLYLSQPLDDPRNAVSQLGVPKPQPIDWKTELQNIMRTGRIACATDALAVMRPGELRAVLNTLLEMVCTVRPRSAQLPTHEQESSNLLWVAAMFRSGFLDQLEQADAIDSLPAEERQIVARLHTYYGVTRADTRAKSLVRSRAFVYNVRNYRPETNYGPFLEDGSVNWVHLQAIHHVMSMQFVNMSEDEEFDFVIFPMSLPYTQIVAPDDATDNWDWAGVTDAWVVSFCFCDHRDLMAFNAANESREDNTLFEDEDFQEAFRSLKADLRVVRAEPDPAHPLHPILHFHGEMQDPSTSTMTGYVKMTPDNQVQWQFMSGEVGSTIWSSVGIQVGGLRSSFGILGSWTTIFHEDDDPVGPFWLCKRSSIMPHETMI